MAVAAAQLSSSVNSSAGSSTLYAPCWHRQWRPHRLPDSSDGGTARVILGGTGVNSGGLDISRLTNAGMGIGSIEGSGIVSLGSKNLTRRWE